MASRSLGTLTIDMVLKTFGLKQGMDKAERDMDAHAKRMEQRAYAIGRGIGTGIKVGIGAAVAAGGFFAAITKQAIDFADQMRDMSIRTGVSTERLSEFAYAARATGTDIETLATGFRKLAQAATEGLNDSSKKGRIFSALGIGKEDLGSLDTLILKLSERFKELPDGVQKTALAVELFGRSGDQMIEFLNQGDAGLAAFAQRARELGIVIDTETAEKADEFNDTIEDLKLSIKGLGIDIASELLPRLVELSNQLSDATTKGTAAKDIASALGTAFDAAALGLKSFVFYAKFVGEHLAYLVETGGNAYVMLKNIATLGAADGTIFGAMRDQRGSLGRFLQSQADRYSDYFGANAQLAAAGMTRQQYTDRFSQQFAIPGISPFNFSQSRTGAFNMAADANARASMINQAALAAALSGQTPTGGGRSGRAGKSAMSEADREAKRLLETFNRLTESQAEQIALYGKTDEVSRMLYRTQQGDLSGLSESQKEQLMAGARRLDQMREEARLMEESTRRDEEHARALRDVLEAIEDERAQLGMTNEERERYNNLKRLSADASEDERRAVIDATDALQQERKAMDDSIALKDEWRNGMVDAITDVVTGAKSLKEAFTDFFDSLAAMITEMIARRWVEQLFGQAGSNQSGSAGGFLNSLFGALFGGGRASGGPVSSGRVYEVGEGNRPELYMSGGREYMIPGNSGRVVPLGGSGRGMTINQVINVPRSTEYRSAQQVGQAALVSAQRALMRNA